MSAPRFVEAVREDARIALGYRSEQQSFGSPLEQVIQVIRLAWVSDVFAALMLYRAKARLQAIGIPVLPRIAHRLAIAIAQVSIGDPVVVRPGVYIPHGHVVVDGITEIGSGVVLAPFVTVGLVAGNFSGPVIGENVQIGTGAKVLGPVTIGAGAEIGANAVVVKDVAPGATAVGVPAHH